MGSLVEAGTLVGTITGADGKVTEVRSAVAGQVVRVLAAGGQTVKEGEGVVGVRVEGH